MKAIIIKDCGRCPYREHRGAHGSVSYVPYCKRVEKTLPHEVTTLERRGRVITIAVPSYEIPQYCPLDDVDYTDTGDF